VRPPFFELLVTFLIRFSAFGFDPDRLAFVVGSVASVS
jgi:hypothetical protein